MQHPVPRCDTVIHYIIEMYISLPIFTQGRLPCHSIRWTAFLYRNFANSTAIYFLLVFIFHKILT